MPMTDSQFTTDNFDLALTKVGEGGAVDYTGPHQGVFRFESVKLAALMTLPADMRPQIPPACYLDPPTTPAPQPAQQPVVENHSKTIL
jgi:hypothetical protein